MTGAFGHFYPQRPRQIFYGTEPRLSPREQSACHPFRELNAGRWRPAVSTIPRQTQRQSKPSARTLAHTLLTPNTASD